MPIPRISTLIFSILLLMATYVAVCVTRPLLPIDETRYVTVAWEYFSRGEWILPTLNFAPYHHKPPMLFWLINLMWHVTGDQTVWAARLVTLIGSVGTLLLTALIARTLWPQDALKSRLVPLLMVATPFFMIYSSLIMFDTLLTLAVLLGMYGVIKAYLTEDRKYWLLIGLAFGLGAIIKGPVILLHLVPVILLFPLWQKDFRADRSTWLEGFAFAVLIGIMIGLSWALPAAKLGGPEYERMIFWGQSAGRMVKAFDHARPFWFYLMLLPVILLPWIYVPAFWRSAPRPALKFPAIKTIWAERSWQTRFIICWTLPVFIAFCLISGKQVHYLMPLLPGAYLLIAHIVVSRQLLQKMAVERLYFWACLPFFVIAAILSLVELIGPLFGGGTASNFAIQMADTRTIYLFIGLLLIGGLGGAVYTLRDKIDTTNGLQAIAAANVIFLIALHFSIQPLLSKYYDLAKAGDVVLNASALGAPVAVANNWQGELGYFAHMSKPVSVLEHSGEIKPWLQQHPNGIVIIRHDADQPPYGLRIVYTQTYRSPNKALSIVTVKK